MKGEGGEEEGGGGGGIFSYATPREIASGLKRIRELEMGSPSSI